MNILTNKWFLGIGISAIVVLSIWLRIEWLTGEVKTLRSDKKKLELVIDEQKKVIGRMEVDYKQSLKFNKTYYKKVLELDRKSDILERVLHRENYDKKSLEDLALLAPQKIEYRINKATEKVIKEIEGATK
jgi:exoribonuclease II